MARLRAAHERGRRLLRAPRLKSLLTAAGFGAALLVIPAGTGTSVANWSVSEYGSGTLKALTVPPPVMIAPCTLSPGVAGTNPVITVNWRFPDGTAYSAPANVNYYVANGGLLQNLTPVTPGSNLSTTGPVGGVYTTQFKSGILVGLLGGSYGVYVQTKDSSGWVSTLAAANASMGLAGTNPVCTVQ